MHQMQQASFERGFCFLPLLRYQAGIIKGQISASSGACFKDMFDDYNQDDHIDTDYIDF